MRPKEIEKRARRDRAAVAAELYFYKGYPQKMIASFLKCSVAEVSRLLAFAQSNGIVEIIVNTSTADETVRLQFNFPKEIRVACEQYLLYFGQFLSDLGIEVNTSINNESSRTLFTVTPSDRSTALKNIREALGIYLDLPSSQLSDTVNDSITVLTLRSEIHQLHSKLSLAAATLQAKQATIEAKDHTIELLKMINISGPAISSNSSLKTNVQVVDSQSESLIRHYLSATSIEKYGLKVNLAAIVRRLKKLLEKER